MLNNHIKIAQIAACFKFCTYVSNLQKNRKLILRSLQIFLIIKLAFHVISNIKKIAFATSIFPLIEKKYKEIALIYLP